MMEQRGYIDIHSHIMPGVDDGAADWIISREMLRMAYAEGIRIIIATPHYMHGARTSIDQLQERLKQLQEEAKRINPDFKIYLGNEIFYESGCLDAVKEGRALTLAGSRYVLIEFAEDEKFNVIYQAMQNFIVNGYFPIIAHIERYRSLYKRNDRVKELIELGCYLQVNISSIRSSVFNRRTRMIRKLILCHMVQFIATDAHNVEIRRPRMESVLSQVSKQSSSELLDCLTKVNPMKVIKNEYI